MNNDYIVRVPNEGTSTEDILAKIKDVIESNEYGKIIICLGDEQYRAALNLYKQ